MCLSILYTDQKLIFYILHVKYKYCYIEILNMKDNTKTIKMRTITSMVNRSKFYRAPKKYKLRTRKEEQGKDKKDESKVSGKKRKRKKGRAGKESKHEEDSDSQESGDDESESEQGPPPKKRKTV